MLEALLWGMPIRTGAQFVFDCSSVGDCCPAQFSGCLPVAVEYHLAELPVVGENRLLYTAVQGIRCNEASRRGIQSGVQYGQPVAAGL